MESIQDLQNFKHVLLLLGWAVGVVAIFRRLHLPAVLGYICVGILIGPGGLGFISDFSELSFIAEFGVVFLMFTIGLEFSIPHLMSMKRALLGLGSAQMILCTGVAMLVGSFFLPLSTAFVTAGALALSSTAIVLNQLTQQNEIHSTHSRLAISILLFQDIAAVLFLILIPALGAGNGISKMALTLKVGTALVKGIGVSVLMALAGKWILRPLFHEVAKSYSTELFMLTVLLTALGSAWLTHHLGLSMALGAFLAGMMMGETEFRHQIEIDIRPFRDVLLGLFFITIGALLNLRALPNTLGWVLLILGSIIALKTALISGLVWLMGQVPKPTALRTGILLAQGGEFGFAVLTLAITNGLIDPEKSQVVIAAVVLSIIVAPFLIRYNKTITKWFFRRPDVISAEAQTSVLIDAYPLSQHASAMSDHVIICGFGRVGQILARFLAQEHISHVALDLDPVRISSSSLAGEHAFYGDARRPEVLAAAGLARARMIVISFSEEESALEILKHIRTLRSDVPIFVRTKDDSNLEAFQDAGATEVVPESLEASLMLAAHLLLALGVSTNKILHKIREVHADRYRIMQGFFKGADDTTGLTDLETERMSLHAITVEDEAFAVGKSVGEVVDAEGESPIKVINRGKQRINDPTPDTIIHAGDVLVLYTTPEALAILEERILRGTFF